MSTLKYSRQRESIKNFLAGRKDHPTAETIYSSPSSGTAQDQSGNCVPQPVPSDGAGGDTKDFYR